jgi:hypothetical protein
MIQQPEYSDVLFLFNDNQEQFLDFIDELDIRKGCAKGGGNAAIRPYQCATPTRAAGIPTGSNGRGYNNLNQSKQYIDGSFLRIKSLLNTGNYKRVMYSAGKDGRSLGTSIFSPSEQVKEYIISNIEKLAQ